MKAQMILETLIAGKPSIEKLMNSTNLNVKLSFRLGKLIQEINPILVAYEETRKKLVRQFGEKDEKGNVNVTQENLPAFATEMQAVLQEEISLTSVPTIWLEDLEKEKSLTPADMAALSPWLIKDEEPS